MGTTVIKIGGSTLESLSESFYAGLAERVNGGEQIVIVHGGGPAINQQLEALAIPSQFVNGLRKTTLEVLKVAESVLCGQMNKEVVRKLHQAGAEAVGLCGCDGALLLAKEIDFNTLGYVGEVTEVRSKIVDALLAKQMVPVIAPIGMDIEGNPLNINADTAAAAVAQAVYADEFVFVTDVDGVLQDGQKMDELNEQYARELIQAGVISGGMVPKVTAAIASLTDRLTKVRIVSGKKRFHANAGTVIVKESTVFQ